MRERVVIVGGGFGGLAAAKGLRRADVDITLIDTTNHHLFQPLLYQVATGGLSPADIASPIRHVLRRQKNVRVLEDTVTEIHTDHVVTEHDKHPFDRLVVATGATHHYFGNNSWAAHARGLKTLPDAISIRADILEAFEQAERAARGDLLFIVIGGGPTGVEMAGSIAEMARDTLKHDFVGFDTATARVVLIEAGPRILPSFPERLSAKAHQQLEGLGAEVLTGHRVTRIDDRRVDLQAEGGQASLAPDVIVWAAGVKASPLGAELERLGATLDGAGRVMVADDLTVPGHPNILIVGDLAHVEEEDGSLVPGVAPAAMQMGSYAAARIAGSTTTPFRYKDRGSLATIGRSSGIADFGRVRFSGWMAWAAWLSIHIFFLIGFANRVLVMLQWTWSYVTRDRSARLIVRYGEHPPDRPAPDS